MQRSLVSLTVVFSFFTFILLFSVVASNAQVLSSDEPTLAEELRPFDFTDKYYEDNGVFAFTLVDRKNGADGQSVFEKTADPNFRDIRITATLPAYTGDGAAIFWNYYGGASKESFTNDAAGGAAVDLAYRHPMYVFPSTTVRNTDRQAALIHIDDSYFEKNRIGIAAVFLVEFTDRIYTKRGMVTMQMLAERNGVSLDGTPIIRTAKELEGLTADGMVTVRQAGPDNSDRTPFAVAKVIKQPELGGIAPDAFLIYVKEPDGKPLAAEAHLVSKFECLQGSGLCY